MGKLNAFYYYISWIGENLNSQLLYFVKAVVFVFFSAACSNFDPYLSSLAWSKTNNILCVVHSGSQPSQSFLCKAMMITPVLPHSPPPWSASCGFPLQAFPRYMHVNCFSHPSGFGLSLAAWLSWRVFVGLDLQEDEAHLVQGRNVVGIHWRSIKSSMSWRGWIDCSVSLNRRTRRLVNPIQEVVCRAVGFMLGSSCCRVCECQKFMGGEGTDTQAWGGKRLTVTTYGESLWLRKSWHCRLLEFEREFSGSSTVGLPQSCILPCTSALGSFWRHGAVLGNWIWPSNFAIK